MSVQKPIHPSVSIQFNFFMKDIIILYERNLRSLMKFEYLMKEVINYLDWLLINTIKYLVNPLFKQDNA